MSEAPRAIWLGTVSFTLLRTLQLTLANHSSYPRVGDGAHAQRLRRAYANRETGKITNEQFDDIALDYVAEVVKEQEDAGLDLVTDGLVYWYDLVAHPTLPALRGGHLLRDHLGAERELAALHRDDRDAIVLSDESSDMHRCEYIATDAVEPGV